MNIGIICEYNPFHYGHIYHLEKIKDLYPDSNIILVMSGNITQRGEISLINKWDKALLALKYGVNLVVELPSIFCQSADIFAKGAISILNELNVDKIVFGSELNDKDILIKLAQAQLSDNYELLIQKYLKENSYPKACNLALKEMTNLEINTPNDLLGLSYTKEIIKNNYNIDIVTIKRTNDYHSKKLLKISSATSIREALKNNIDISSYVPKEAKNKINKSLRLENYFSLLKYKILSSDDLTIYNDVNDNLANRIKKNIINSENLEDLIFKIKTKKYTYNRIKRILLFILLDFKKVDNEPTVKYIRILGFDSKGKSYLKKIKDNTSLPIITNYSNSNGLLKFEDKINSILSLVLDEAEQSEFINRDLKEIVRKIDC